MFKLYFLWEKEFWILFLHMAFFRISELEKLFRGNFSD